MKAIVIIPARYGSTRFPGKPLVEINGKPMIQHVYEQAKQATDEVWIATDDLRIEAAIKKFKGKCVMTSSEHRSGTDRLAEAIENIPYGNEFDIVVNIQGDEPFIKPMQITQLISLFATNPNTQIATLVKEITELEDVFNTNKPKVVRGIGGEALYFSRSPIPFLRDEEKSEWHTKHTFFKHIGVYAYRTNVLKEISKLKASPLEKAENLEQLRWLENNYTITTDVTEYENLSVDTPEDLNIILRSIYN